MEKWKIVTGIGLGLLLLSSSKTAVAKLDEEQEEFITKLHPKVRDFFRTFIHRSQNETGWYVDIASGYRTFAKQAILKQQDSRNASPGRSFHNYGMALDINLTKSGERVRKASSASRWLQTGVPQIAEQMGFEWGGRWASYHDPVHFDLRRFLKTKFGCSSSSCVTGKLLDIATRQFGTNWSDIQGNKINLPFNF